MSVYPPNIARRCARPKNAGRLENADAVGSGAAFTCGAVLKFFLQVDKSSTMIEAVAFQTSACGFTIAVAEVLAENLTGKKLSKLQGLNRHSMNAVIQAELENFPHDRRHCLELVFDALQKTFADLRASRIREFNGEEALICTCFGVTEARIEELVAQQSLTEVGEVSALCRAGSGCGACRFLIGEIIDNYWQERL